MELKVDHFYTDEKYFYWVISAKGNYISVFKTDFKESDIDLIKNVDDVSNFREVEMDDKVIEEYYILAAKNMLNR